MAEKVIKRTDTIVKIESAIEDTIGTFFKIFFHDFGGLVSKGIESSKLKYTCKYCNYSDGVQREYCSNCLRNSNGAYIEAILPFQCKHCFKRFEKAFRYCPACHKNERGKSELIDIPY